MDVEVWLNLSGLYRVSSRVSGEYPNMKRTTCAFTKINIITRKEKKKEFNSPSQKNPINLSLQRTLLYQQIDNPSECEQSDWGEPRVINFFT